MRVIFAILIIMMGGKAVAQTIGGAAVYNFLKLPPAPLQSAAGGINISYQGDDVTQGLSNPALLSANLHTQTSFSFNSYFAQTKAYQLAGAYHAKKQDATLAGSIFFIDYGDIPQTNSIGEAQGNFRPREFVVQFSAGKKYLEHWQYGASIKWIHSDYGSYRSAALAFDGGVSFVDSARLISISLLAKNMGVQLSAYGEEKEDLPFDLQLGITKKLAKAPLAFSVTAQQLHQFDLAYNDTAFNNENAFSSKASFFNKVFNHFILASHIYIGSNAELTAGYNHLRRTELNLGNASNGLNGFSAGIRAKFRKLHFQYARSYFGLGQAYNQFGLHLFLSRFSVNGDL